jgi:hypothetical protein
VKGLGPAESVLEEPNSTRILVCEADPQYLADPREDLADQLSKLSKLSGLSELYMIRVIATPSAQSGLIVSDRVGSRRFSGPGKPECSSRR